MEAVDLLVDEIQKSSSHLSKIQIRESLKNYIFNEQDLRIDGNIEKYAKVISFDLNLLFPNSSSPVNFGKLIPDSALVYQTNYIFDFGYNLFDFNNEYFDDYFSELFSGSKQTPLPLLFKAYSNSTIGVGGSSQLVVNRKIQVTINDELIPIQNRNVLYELIKPSGNLKGNGISIDFAIPQKYKNTFIGQISFINTGGNTTDKVNYLGDLDDFIQNDFRIESDIFDSPTTIKSIERTQNGLILTLNKNYNFDSGIRGNATITTDAKQKVQFSLSMNASTELKPDSKNLRVYILDVLTNEKYDTGLVLLNTLPNTKITFNGSFTPSYSKIYRMMIEVDNDDVASYKVSLSDFSVKGLKLNIKDVSLASNRNDSYFLKSQVMVRDAIEGSREIYPIVNTSEDFASDIKSKIESFKNKTKIKPQRFLSGAKISKAPEWRSTGLARFIGSSSLIKTITALSSVRVKLQSIVSGLETARQIANVLSQIEELATDPLTALGRSLITEFKDFINSAKTSGIYLLDLSEITCGVTGQPLGVRYFFENESLEKILARGKNSGIVNYQLNQQNSNADYLSQTTPSERAQDRKETTSISKYVDNLKFKKGLEVAELVPYFHAPMTFDELISKIADSFIDPYDRADASVLDGVVTWRAESPVDAPIPSFAPQSFLGLDLRGETPIPGSSQLKPRPFTFRSGAPQWGKGTNATVHILIYSAPNLTLFINMHKRFQRFFNGKSYSDPAYKLWDSYVSFYEDLVERFRAPDFNPANIIRSVDAFNRIHAPSGGGNLPDFYGINLYSLMPNLFTRLDQFVKYLESYLTFANDTLSEVIRTTIDTIQKGIDGIINIINLIDDIIEFLETLLLIQFSVLTVNSTDGVYDIREKIINAEGFPANIIEPNKYSEAIKDATENGIDVPAGVGASEQIVNNLTDTLDQSKKQKSIPDIREKQMWFGGIVIGYGISNDLSVYSESIKKNFENLSQEWDESRGELKQNLQSAKNNSETDSLIRRIIR